MNEKWLLCPVCDNKTRIKIRVDSIGVFYDTVKLSLLFSVIYTAIWLISMRIGFIKKFSHISLITSFACSVLLINLLGISLLADLDTAMIGFTIFAIILSVAVVLTLGLTHRSIKWRGNNDITQIME